MQKIPTIFVRDWEGDRSRVLDEVNPGCEWVFAGEGVATRKYDGSCCRVRGEKLFKRRELTLRPGQALPPGFVLIEADPETGKTVGWVPVGGGPEDRWHLEAFGSQPHLPDGTYELVGPKVQGNPEGFDVHTLLRHGDMLLQVGDRSFATIRDFLARERIEGIVFHHPDGRMGKIKARDFGISR